MFKKILTAAALLATVSAFTEASAQTYETKTNPLKFTLAKQSTGYLLYGRNTYYPCYQNIFYVDYAGGVGATSLDLSSQPLDNTYVPKLKVSYSTSDFWWNISTQSYSGGYYPLNFSAKAYYFNQGSMTIANGSLTVNGSITCKNSLDVTSLNTEKIKTNEIYVDLNNAADYVFEDDYDLKPLSEVESYVKTNKHLPGVPSANEFSKNGMNVSEMSNILLQKVEELTLHMIELEKENQNLKSEIEQLKK